MAYVPPSIRINGGAPGVKASVAAAGAVNAALDSTDGVTFVEWSVSTTDETTAPGDYVLVQGGAIGETVATTALVAGTAAILYVKINRGVDPRTGVVNLDTTTATCKFYVPTTATSLEVGCAGEDFESDATYGSTGIVNAGVRITSTTAAGVQDFTWKDDVYAITTANLALTGAPALGNTDNVVVPDGARLLVGNNQAVAADRGIYVVDYGGAWARAVDADTENALVGATVYVANGATSTGWIYQQTVQTPIVVGVTALSWTRTVDRFDRDDLATATSAATANKLFRRDGSGGGVVGYLESSTYLSTGAAPALAGAVRLSNNTAINWRNAAASANINGASIDGTDKLVIGDGTNASGASLSVKAANSIDFAFGANVRLSVKDALFEFQPSATAHIKQADATAGAGSLFDFTAQTAFAGVGGGIRITTGRGATNADQCGALTINVGDDTSTSSVTTFATRTLGNFLEIQYVGGTGSATIATPTGSTKAINLVGDAGAALGATTGSTYLLVASNPKVTAEANGVSFFGGAGYGTGTGVISIANASVNPSTNPTGGGILYADAGAGKWRGSGGTVTTFGPAEPHCPTCGRDFAHEWENKRTNEHLAVCMPCMLETLEQIGIDVNAFAFVRRLS